MLSGQKACLALRRGLNSTNEKAKNYYFLVPKEIETNTQHREINWRYGVFWPSLRICDVRQALYQRCVDNMS